MFKVSLTIILQDIQQLEDIYGRSASTIFNGGMASKLFSPGLSLSSCQQVEQILGNQTVLIEERPPATLADPWPKPRSSEARGPLLTSSEVRQLPDDCAIFVHANKAPVLVHTRPYYETRAYSISIIAR